MRQRVAICAHASTVDLPCAQLARNGSLMRLREFSQRRVRCEAGTERRGVMALARERNIDAALVTELSRRGRSTADQLHPPPRTGALEVTVVAMSSGLIFDLGSQHGERAR